MNVLSKIKTWGIQEWLRIVIFALVSGFTALSVLSDRTPYNYLCFGVAGLLSVVIVIYVWCFHSFVFDRFTGLILLFNLCILLSQITNLQLLSFPRTIFLLSLLSVLFYQFAVGEKSKEKIFLAILAGGVLFAAYFLFYYRSALIHLDFSDRLGRDFSDQNDLAKNLALFALIAFVFLFRKTILWKRILFGLAFLLFTFLILVTGSISGLLSFGISGIVVAFFCIKKKYWWILILTGVSLIVFGIAALQLPFLEYFKTRIENMLSTFFGSNGQVDYSALDRSLLAKTGFLLFLTRPIFGLGYDQIQFYTLGFGSFSHNNFVELLGSFGLAGFLCFEALLLIPTIQNFRAKRKDAFVFATLFFLFLFQIFLVIFRKKIEFLLLPIAFSVIRRAETPCFVVTRNGWKPVLETHHRKTREKAFDRTARPMRVLEITHALNPVGGAETFSVNFVSALSKTIEVRTIVLHDDCNPGLLERLKATNTPFDILRKKSHLDIRVICQVSRIIDEFQPDIIHTENNALLTAFLASMTTGIRIVHTLHLLCQYECPSFVMRSVYSYIFRHRRVCPVAISEEVEKSFHDVYHFKKTVPLIRNGVDVRRFSCSRPIADRPYLAALMGRFEDVKNHEMALAIFKKAHEILPKARFAFAGTGPLFDRYRAQASEEGMDYVDFLGLVNDVPRFLSEVKTLILTSKHEANPLSLLEGMSAGCLICATAVGGIPDMIADGVNGFLFALGDVDAFAEKLVEIGLDPDAFEAQRSNSSRYLALMNIDRMIDAYLSLFLNDPDGELNLSIEI